MITPDRAIDRDDEEPEREEMTRRLPTALSRLATGLWSTSLITVVADPLHGLLLPAIAVFVVIPLSAVIRALWEGARPKVVQLGGALADALLSRLSRRLHIENGPSPPRSSSGAGPR